MADPLATSTVELAQGELTILQPREAAELPDDQEVKWAPVVPFWSVLWRSGIALARELSSMPLAGSRILELGCGLGAPSLAAAKAGATVLATDTEPEAIELVRRSAELNGVELEAEVVEWSRPARVLDRAPFDLVIGSDVFYEPESVTRFVSLLPRLAPEALIADPGRAAFAGFLDPADCEFEMRRRGPVAIYEIRFHSEADPTGPS